MRAYNAIYVVWVCRVHVTSVGFFFGWVTNNLEFKLQMLYKKTTEAHVE